MEPYTFDLQRIFFGDLPITFLFEILLRTAVIFSYTLILLRLVGHRGLSQLSIAEFTLIIALGSAVGDPMFQPDIPLIHGMFVVTLIVAFQRLVTTLTLRSKRLSRLIEGRSQRIVVQGLLDLQGIKEARMSSYEIFAELRQSGTEHLGQIQYAYLELDGEVSVLKYQESDVRPGLSLMWDEELRRPDALHDGDQAEAGYYACTSCGYTDYKQDKATLQKCPRCHEGQWVRADLPSAS